MSDEYKNTKRAWSLQLQPLVGKKIIGVRYLTDEEKQTLGWNSASVVLHLDDGTLLFPSRDDEGNDAGALFIQPGKNTKALPEAAPVI